MNSGELYIILIMGSAGVDEVRPPTLWEWLLAGVGVKQL